MIALSVFFVLVSVEIAFFTLQRTRVQDIHRKKSIAWIILSSLLVLALLTPLLTWSLAWLGVFLLCLYKTIRALVYLWKQGTPKQPKFGLLIVKIVLYLCIAVPLALFPGTKEVSGTGDYAVKTETYTWTDESREEEFTVESDFRRVTVQFWYPEDTQKSYPLIIFSHGAFGYRKSNYSTYIELARNGYVVCSIDHPYHSFMTKQADGKTIIVNTDFLRTAMDTEQGKIVGEELFNLEQIWMELRTQDMDFVLHTILREIESSSSSHVFAHIDKDEIGVIGHSMGGATAAALGRNRNEIDAVIVLDGTMMGETIAYTADTDSFIQIPYPKPILNVFNEDHAKQAKALGNLYPNTFMHHNSDNSYQVVVNGSGHLNFTDLPLVSPILAGVLGVGSVDAVYCMETTNTLALEFFNKHLKHVGGNIPKVRIL